MLSTSEILGRGADGCSPCFHLNPCTFPTRVQKKNGSCLPNFSFLPNFAASALDNIESEVMCTGQNRNPQVWECWFITVTEVGKALWNQVQLPPALPRPPLPHVPRCHMHGALEHSRGVTEDALFILCLGELQWCCSWSCCSAHIQPCPLLRWAFPVPAH